MGKKIKLIIAYSIIPLLISEYFFLMLGISVHSFVVTPIVLLMDLLSLTLIVKAVLIKNTKGFKLFFIWISFNLLTFFAYLSNDLPYDCFFEMLRPYIFPMLFFMLGIDIDVDKNKFYNIFLYTVLFSCVVGIILYITTPPFYISYLSSLLSQKWYGTNSSESYIFDTFRMCSFFGDSYAISFLSVPAMSVALGKIFNTNEKKARIYYIITVIAWISALLCQQRVAMFFSIVVILYFFYVSNHRLKGRFFLVGIIIFGIISAILFLNTTERYDMIKEVVKSRFTEMSFSEAYEGSRTDQVESTVKSINDFVFGDGLGARSTPARKYGHPGISDVEYVRLLAESGIVGVLLFLMLFISSGLKALKAPTVYFTELTIIGFFMFAMIGSNALSISHLYSPILWFSLGVIWKPQMIRFKVYE